MAVMRLLAAVPIAAVLLLAGVYLLTPLSRLELPAPHGGYLDAHAWILGVGAGGSGVFVSRELARCSTFNAYLDSFGVTRADLERHGDGLIARRMNTLLAGSRHVRSAVVLAVDGVVRDDRIDHAATWLHVPNDYVAGLADEHPHLEFGASIHPRRSDWQRRLNRARRRGARLVYWLPSLMDIDPADPAHIPFYQALAGLGMPLLVQLGRDPAFGQPGGEPADPRQLIPALEQGVTVIAARLATDGRYGDAPGHRRLLSMFEAYPNLFADTSRLTGLGDLGALAAALETPGAAERMIYGSGWPSPALPWFHPFQHWPDIDLSSAKTIRKIDNILDRDVALKAALGVPGAVFRRSAGLLHDTADPAPGPPGAALLNHPRAFVQMP